MLVGHLVGWRTPRVMQIVWMKLQKTRHHALPSLNGCFQVMLEIEQNSSKIDCNAQQRRLNLHRSCSPSLPYPWIRACLGYFPEMALLKSFFLSVHLCISPNLVGNNHHVTAFICRRTQQHAWLMLVSAFFATFFAGYSSHVDGLKCPSSMDWWGETNTVHHLCIYMILHVCFCMDWLLCDAKGI